MERLCALYGYRPITTPAFEDTALFERTSGPGSDVVQKEMYTFEDRGGRQLTLRPEATAGIVRAYLAHAYDLPSPFKAYTVAAMWRYGRPQSGRYREFRQFDIEVIGAAEPAADVEVVAVGDRFLRDAGLDRLRLEVNSIGDEVCRPAYREELIGYLAANRDALRDEHRDRFRDNPLRVLDCKDDACRRVAAGAPKISDRLCGPCAEHFAGVQDGLRAEGIAFVHEPTLVRGLDYYTRTAFEFVAEGLSEGQGTVCGGGRYDGLAEVLGGPPTPGVGFASGLDRILLALEDEGRTVPGIAGLECFVAAVGPTAQAAAADVARRLRSAGVSTLVPFDVRSLKSQLRMADRHGARHAVIVGEREAGTGTVTLRRLDDGTQEELSVADLVRRLAPHAGGDDGR